MRDLYQWRPIFFVWGRGRGFRQWVIMPQNINQNIFFSFWVFFNLFPKSRKIRKLITSIFSPLTPLFFVRGGERGTPWVLMQKIINLIQIFRWFWISGFFKLGKIFKMLFLAEGQKKLYGCEGGYPGYVLWKYGPHSCIFTHPNELILVF